MIVGIGDDADIVGVCGNEAVLRVPGVRPDAVRCQVAVAVVRWLPRRRGDAEDVGVLVERVGPEGRANAVVGRPQRVAYAIVGVCVGVLVGVLVGGDVGEVVMVT